MKEIINRAKYCVILSCSLLILSSCSKEESLARKSSDELRINNTSLESSLIKTKASASSVYFTDNDRIGVSDKKEPVSSGIYNYNGTSWESVHSTYWGNVNSGKIFYAWHPVVENCNFNNYTILVDQSNTSKLKEADYMTAQSQSYTSIPSDKGINLTFSHKLSKIVIKIVKQEADSKGELKEAHIYSPKTSVNESINTPIRINPLEENDIDCIKKYTGMVIPTSLVNFKLFSLKVGSDSQERDFTTSMNIEANKIYEFKLVMGDNNSIVSVGLTAKPWTIANDNPSGNISASYWEDFASSSFASGDGSQASPFEISTPEQLARLISTASESTGKYYRISQDIDLSGKEWKSIGDENIAFRGYLDGGNHTIKNLDRALFESVNHGKLENINFSCVDIISKEHSFALLAKLIQYTQVENCNVSGNITIDSRNAKVAGLVVDMANNSSITKCSNTANINSSREETSIAGIVYSTKLENNVVGCFNTGNLSSNFKVGGISVDHVGIIIGCYNTGTISYTNSGAGIACDNSRYAEIYSCYSSGDVNYGIAYKIEDTTVLSSNYFTQGDAYLNVSSSNNRCEKVVNLTSDIFNIMNTNWSNLINSDYKYSPTGEIVLR